MSALWILGLGASMGYMMFKRQAMDSLLEQQVRKYDAHDDVAPADPSGATMREIKAAWRSTTDVEDRDFNERLPQSERDAYLAGAQQARKEVVQYEARGEAPIEGVWLDGLPS